MSRQKDKERYARRNAKVRRAKQVAYEAHPKLCKVCGAKIEYERRHASHCSNSCAAKTANAARIKDYVCPSCGEVFSRGWTHAKFCSTHCASEYRHQEYIKAWLEGSQTGRSGEGVSTHIRRYLAEKYGEKCALCGWAEINPKTGRVAVQLDHIDGDYTNCREDNLRFLCPNHHVLTETWGALNKGNGRKLRRHKRSAKKSTL